MKTTENDEFDSENLKRCFNVMVIIPEDLIGTASVGELVAAKFL